MVGLFLYSKKFQIRGSYKRYTGLVESNGNFIYILCIL
ncbi:hypothetical protein EHF_0926 [Ehrlichia japonica]|uniref:Uncharacterized protein n=1 Tax=Ehrlichia japonica TaxID=391036 RepID=X5GC21_9RICK|nr:hypothetical protein EHF_0926 [Ehrlichia japonica]